jgi:hypothetical protein
MEAERWLTPRRHRVRQRLCQTDSIRHAGQQRAAGMRNHTRAVRRDT